MIVWCWDCEEFWECPENGHDGTDLICYECVELLNAGYIIWRDRQQGIEWEGLIA